MGINVTTPSWLFDMINGSYATSRTRNRSSKDLSHFCIECRGPPFREDDMKSHSGHTVLRVCKASGHYAVHCNRISELLDCSGINVFVINKKGILFLNSRQGSQRHDCSGKSPACKICGWMLQSASDMFCSLGCKFQKKRKSEVEELISHPTPVKENPRQEKGPAIWSAVKEPDQERLNLDPSPNKFDDTGLKEIRDSSPMPAANPKKRSRRKGIPQRAPLF